MPQTKTNEWKCKICDKSFKHKQTLNNHKNQKHSNKVFACSKCQAKFSSNFALKRHSAEKRCKEKKFTFECPTCGIKCLRKYNLDRHISRHHSSSVKETFECQTCAKPFYSTTALTEHKKIHILKVSSASGRFRKNKTQDKLDLSLALGDSVNWNYGLDDDDDNNEPFSMVSLFIHFVKFLPSFHSLLLSSLDLPIF